MRGGPEGVAGAVGASRSFFGFAEIAGWLLATVHVRGPLERRQPPIEHAKVALYSGCAVAARIVRP